MPKLLLVVQSSRISVTYPDRIKKKYCEQYQNYLKTLSLKSSFPPSSSQPKKVFILKSRANQLLMSNYILTYNFEFIHGINLMKVGEGTNIIVITHIKTINI